MTGRSGGLLFDVSQFLREIQAFPGIASSFLAPGSEGVIRQMGRDLTNAMKYTSPGIDWKVNTSNPIRTRESMGEYMPDNHGALHVFAEISFIWVIDPERPRGNTRPASSFRLNGKASTMIRLMQGSVYSASDAIEIAMWRMEVGDDAAPGSHFHVQVMGHETDPPFPKALDIPRLPGLFVSPLACVEFVISELFQDEWKKESVRSTSDMDRWRGVQSDRTIRQLEWHLAQAKAATGSPWTAMKIAKPADDLFV